MDGAPSLKSGLSSWTRSKAHGEGAPRNTDAVGTIRYAAPRIGALSSELFLHCAKQPAWPNDPAAQATSFSVDRPEVAKTQLQHRVEKKAKPKQKKPS